jgi:hypothetical protein
MKYPGGRVMIWAFKGDRLLSVIVDTAKDFGVICCRYRSIYPRLFMRQLKG